FRRRLRSSTLRSHPLFEEWRRERDSNPRWAFGPYTLSRGAPSTTRPSLRRLNPFVRTAEWTGSRTHGVRVTPYVLVLRPFGATDSVPESTFEFAPGESSRPLGSALSGRRTTRSHRVDASNPPWANSVDGSTADPALRSRTPVWLSQPSVPACERPARILSTAEYVKTCQSKELEAAAGVALARHPAVRRST